MQGNLSRPSNKLFSVIKYILFLTITVVLVFEICIRTYYTLRTTPRAWLYGTHAYRNIVNSRIEKGRKNWKKKHYTDRTVEIHEKKLGGYTKFFPNEHKTDQNPDTGKVIEVKINSQGFRGKEFTTAKKNGVIRVITLGASSTFGYYNEDETTYPAQLEAILNNRCDNDIHFEVINFGIPHLNSKNILSLFEEEGMALKPDFVTIYAGSNDSLLKDTSSHMNLAQKIHQLLHNKLLMVNFVDYIFESKIKKPNLVWDKEYAQIRSDFFIENLAAINKAIQSQKGKLIVASQQKKSLIIPREELEGVTYAEEQSRVRKKFNQEGNLDIFEYSFLIHQSIMDELRLWTKKNGIPYVDILDLLDKQRHLLYTYVHLHPEANSIIASAFADEILKHSCR